jgi:hypothetical protein
MAEWKTLIKEDLSPPQARAQSRSKHMKPVRYQKVEWDDKTSEIQQQVLKTRQELSKLDLIFSSHAKDITPEIATKAAKRQVILKKKLDSLYTAEKATKQKQAISQQIAEVQTRIENIRHEIKAIDQFLSNPFGDKQLSSNQRKAAWLKAADRKKALEKALRETVKEWNKLTLEEKVTKRQRRN